MNDNIPRNKTSGRTTMPAENSCNRMLAIKGMSFITDAVIKCCRPRRSVSGSVRSLFTLSPHFGLYQNLRHRKSAQLYHHEISWISGTLTHWTTNQSHFFVNLLYFWVSQCSFSVIKFLNNKYTSEFYFYLGYEVYSYSMLNA